MLLLWLRAIAGVVVLVASGALVRRAARLPGGAVGTFVVAHLMLFVAAFVLQIAGVPIRLASVGALLLLADAVAAWILRRRTAGDDAAGVENAIPAPPTWLAAMGALAVLAFALRVTTRPLQGADAVWRWEFLARRLLDLGHLDFYPPLSSADFGVYAFCDAIPPLQSVVYWWIYACAGVGTWDGPTGWPLTGLALAWQYAVALLAAYGLGCALARTLRREAGVGTSAMPGDDERVRRAGSCAAVLAFCTHLSTRSIGIGHESGLLIVSVLAIVLACAQASPRSWFGPAILAGLASALGALSREYGLAFGVAGLATLLARARSARAALPFTIAFAALVLPWYLRTWLLTGNPLYSHAIPGFASNPVYVEIMRGYGETLGWAGPAGGAIATTALETIASECLLVAIAGLAALAWRPLRFAWLAGWMALIVALWAISVPVTTAGPYQSIRVAAPALSLLAVVGGVGAAEWVAKPVRGRLAVLVVLAVAGACWASLQLLVFPHTARQALSSPDFAGHAWTPRPMYRLYDAPRAWGGSFGPGTAYVTDDFYQYVTLASHRSTVEAVPIWSPRAAALFDPSLGSDEVFARLVEQGVVAIWIDPSSLNAVGVSRLSPTMEGLYRQVRRERAGAPSMIWIAGPASAPAQPRATPPASPGSP